MPSAPDPLDASDVSHDNHRVIFDNSVAAIFVLDWDSGAILDVNRRACEAYGYTLEEFRQLSAGDLGDGQPPHTRAEARRYMALAREGRCPTFEWHRRNKDGSLHWDEVNVKPAALAGRRVLLMFARDVTDRKNALDQLQRSEARLRATVEAAFDCVIAMDHEGRVLEFNSAAERVFGYARDEAIGRPLSELIIPEPQRAAHERGLRRFQQTGQGAMLGRLVETIARRRDGSEFPVELAISQAPVPGGTIFVGHLRDITARRAAEADRGALEAQLRQAQKMEAVGQLTGGIAHDFNNILTSVMGYVVLAQERAEVLGDPTLVRQLGQAHLAAQRARDLISQMLAFSRRQKGDPRPLALTPLARQTLRLLRSTLPSSIALDAQWMDADAAGDEAWVVADPVQLEQILFNLCINARDAMQGAGSITVRLGQHDGGPQHCASCRGAIGPGRWVELRVSDTGSGIAAEHLDRIFDPFFSTKPPGQGSGMGLAMVHGIVHDHGGHLLVDTTLGEGSTFKVLLPSVPPATRSPQALRVHAAAAGVLPAANVLLVEDDPAVGEYLQEQLTHWGLRVTLLRDPAAALRWLAAPPVDPQLLLTDLTMPGMTGLQLAREARRAWPRLPILLVTGNASHIGPEELSASGIACALKKPVDPGVLRTSLQALLH